MNPTESKLFSPFQIGNLMIDNRFIRSATFEGAANDDGSVSEDYAKIYKRLAKGKIGMIITGMISISKEGKSYKRQASLHSDEMIPGFSQLLNEVHEIGGKVFAQMTHGGRQTDVQGKFPKAPSFGIPDMVYRVIPRQMSVKDIKRVIKDFGNSALRAKKAGFDGVQIHGAHGYLISQFLSPFFNHRNDEWGKGTKGRFQFLKKVFYEIREKVGEDYPVIVKLNIEDNTPLKGISIEDVVENLKSLVEMGIDGVETSRGTLAFSMFDMCRGSVPSTEMSKIMPKPVQTMTSIALKLNYPEKKFAFTEAYNKLPGKKLKEVLNDCPLILVGGMRGFPLMDQIVTNGEADCISLCRPLIREPLMIKKWSKDKITYPTCVNCNKCLAGLAHHMVLKCREKEKF